MLPLSAKRMAQRGDELAPGIVGVCGKEFVMLRLPRRVRFCE